MGYETSPLDLAHVGAGWVLARSAVEVKGWA